MSQRPNPDEWRVIDFTTDYACGHVYSRLRWLMEDDPFCSVLTQSSRDSLCAMVTRALGPSSDGMKSVEFTEPWEINLAIRNAFSKSALAMMFSPQFIRHFTDLVSTAVLAGNKENGVLI